MVAVAANRAAVQAVTERIVARSAVSRGAYLAHLAAAIPGSPYRGQISCTNLAHGFAASSVEDKLRLRVLRAPNVGIVTAYNDMLSAHQPYATYPEQIKAAVRAVGATAQVAGGVPAMCDGITQGQPGMELSLFSRDVIALATSVAMSHNMFDAGLCLGVCDKIVPGLVMGALRFGHLPFVFVPAGPMPTGISNEAKAKMRQRYVAGEVGQEALLESEAQSYHSAGTCTFYGTANSNQMLMEIMGLHLPGAAFVPPGDALREALTAAAAQRAVAIVAGQPEFAPIGRVIDEKAVVNGIVGLLATGGSTNHTLHLVAMARAAGIVIDWQDFAALSAVVPLLAKVYPNGSADINAFHAAGGMAFLIGELLSAGLLHEDVQTIAGPGLARYAQAPYWHAGALTWQAVPASSDHSVLAPVDKAFSREGGLCVLAGNLGRGVIKVSAVAADKRQVAAPAMVFDSQDAVLAAGKRGDLNKDCIVVLRYQGPRANGMPELHKLTPLLANLQDQGFKVALVTDGRMSGASGKVPAAIHVCPEAAMGGPLARVAEGDWIELDAERGVLRLSAEGFDARQVAPWQPPESLGWGRELFGNFRQVVSSAEEGACSLSLF